MATFAVTLKDGTTVTSKVVSGNEEILLRSRLEVDRWAQVRIPTGATTVETIERSAIAKTVRTP